LSYTAIKMSISNNSRIRKNILLIVIAKNNVNKEN